MTIPVGRVGPVRLSFLLASVAVPLLLVFALVPFSQGLHEPAFPFALPIILIVGLVVLFGAFRGRIVPFLIAAVIWVPAMYYLSIAWAFGLVVWLYGGP